jgi:hypothetical protein
MGFKVKYMQILNLKSSLPFYLLILTHKFKSIEKLMPNWFSANQLIFNLICIYVWNSNANHFLIFVIIIYVVTASEVDSLPYYHTKIYIKWIYKFYLRVSNTFFAFIAEFYND